MYSFIGCHYFTVSLWLCIHEHILLWQRQELISLCPSLHQNKNLYFSSCVLHFQYCIIQNVTSKLLWQTVLLKKYLLRINSFIVLCTYKYFLPPTPFFCIHLSLGWRTFCSISLENHLWVLTLLRLECLRIFLKFSLWKSSFPFSIFYVFLRFWNFTMSI